MSNNQRDTQFQGFAKALWDELEQAIRQDPGFIPEGKTGRDRYIPEWEGIIARRAYDLAIHVLDESRGTISRDPAFVIKHNVSDMTDLQKEQE